MGGGLTPEIERYLGMWERDPKSRVFAPLAEAYRKIGQLDRAIEISQKGLQIHPNYVSGRVALGRAFFEKGDYPNAKTQLEMVFEADPENLVAAKTLGEIYESEGNYEKALLAYRLAHYTTPGAVEITQKLKNVESALAAKQEEYATSEERSEALDREMEELARSLEAARRALRISEAREAGDMELEIPDAEGDVEYQDENRRFIAAPGAIYAAVDEEEITLEMDMFFSENPVSTSGEYEGFQVREIDDAIVADGRGRKDELANLTHTELLLRQGYVERAIKVYQEFLDSEPDNAQAQRRVVELSEQLDDIQYEIRIREGEPGRQVREEEERKEVVYTLVDWLQKVKTRV